MPGQGRPVLVRRRPCRSGGRPTWAVPPFPPPLHSGPRGACPGPGAARTRPSAKLRREVAGCTSYHMMRCGPRGRPGLVRRRFSRSGGRVTWATQPLHNSTRARAAQAQGPVQPGPIRRLSFGGWSLGAPHITLRSTGMTPSVASAAGGPKSYAVAHTTFGLPARPIRRAPLSDGRTASEGRG